MKAYAIHFYEKGNYLGSQLLKDQATQIEKANFYTNEQNQTRGWSLEQERSISIWRTPIFKISPKTIRLLQENEECLIPAEDWTSDEYFTTEH